MGQDFPDPLLSLQKRIAFLKSELAIRENTPANVVKIRVIEGMKKEIAQVETAMNYLKYKGYISDGQ